jgi:hypothetical protein
LVYSDFPVEFKISSSKTPENGNSVLWIDPDCLGLQRPVTERIASIFPAGHPALISQDGRGGVEMDFTIPEDILSNTTKCWKRFSCLHAGKDRNPCPATDNVNGVLFVDHSGPWSCAYVMSFGRAQTCTCPVRKEIHARYGF